MQASRFDASETFHCGLSVSMTYRLCAMQLESIRRPFEPIIRRLLHFYWRLARGLTVGVRALVVDAEGRVFLVKHSYVSGWQCAPKARIISGGRYHPENCRLVR